MSRFSRHLWLALGMFVVFATTFVLYAWSEKQIDYANESRLQSYLLADELRQSSDDLTRMVRTYVVTGNPIYKQYYQEILDIRDGRKPRPADYGTGYWDVVLVDDTPARPVRLAVPLLELMRRAGFTEEEFGKLTEAKANSDGLTATEFAAMKLIEVASPPSDTDRARAVAMLYDADYHRAKASIMMPIREFHRGADERTRAAVYAAENRATYMRVAFIVFGLLLMYLLWSIRRSLYAILGGPVAEVYMRISHLGSGNFSSALSATKATEDNVLGWLSETQTNLALIDAQRKQSNSELLDARAHLLQSDKMASLGQLAAGLAHEINNPIGYVNSNLGSLEHYLKNLFLVLDAYEQVGPGPPDSAALERVAEMKRRVDLSFLREDAFALMDETRDGISRVKRIVQDLKDFSRAGAHDEWQFADLHQGLDTTLNMVSSEIKYKAQVIKDYGTLPQIECLPSQLNQVFLNLLVNSAHAIEERGTITIRSGVQDDEVWIEISDTGTGIAPEDMKHIFDPFFTTKPVGKGTGLGLSVSYGIVRKHNGRIEVHSEVGRGTTFRVCLPANRKVAPAAGIAVAPASDIVSPGVVSCA